MKFQFDTANEAQKKAIIHKDGPLLIIAGPGTGKTFTLVNRLLYMILEYKIAPENILVCTFTEKAAKELITRISNGCEKYGIDIDLNAMYIGTIHSICLRIIKENAEYLQDFNKNFQMLDEKMQSYIVHSNLRFFYDRFGGKDALTEELEPFKTYTTSSDWITETICKLVNKFSEDMVDTEQMMACPKTEDDFAEQAAFLGKLLQVYEEFRLEKGFFDFSSIQTQCYALLEQEEVLKRVREKIRYLMIDEYQDTNYVQEQLMFRIAGAQKNICVVGDDDQALYRFRGATVRNILEFPQKMRAEGTELATVTLDINYRSDPQIIDLYNKWMDSPYQFRWQDGDRQYRYPKVIKPAPEKKAIPNSVLKISGIDFPQKICDFIKRLKNEGKITDYNQVVLLGSSVSTISNKSNERVFECFEQNGIPIFSPRSGQFFSRNEVMLAVGLLKKVLYVYADQARQKNMIANQDLNYANEVLQNEKYRELREWAEETIAGFKKNRDKREYSDFTYTELLYQMFAYEPFRSLMGTDSDGNAYETRAVRNLAILTQLTGKYEEMQGVSIIDPNDPSHCEGFFDHYLARIKQGRMEEYESEIDYAPSGCVSFMTIHQSKGMEFPVVISLLDYSIREDEDGTVLIREMEDRFHQPSYEPGQDIAKFDFFRKFYVAFSRAQNMLVLVNRAYSRKYETVSSHESFNCLLSMLPEYSAGMDFRGFEFEKIKQANVKQSLSFTSHIAKYDECPREYMFLKEFEFSPVQAGSFLFGTLVHQTIEDVHRAVLRGEENRITDDGIECWFAANYAALLKKQHVHALAPKVRAEALDQVKQYVKKRNGDWSMIRETEVDVSLVKEDYILEGAIDLVQGNEDTVELVDFKSEKNPLLITGENKTDREKRERELKRLERYKKQLKVYAHLVEKRTGRHVSAMNLYYTAEKSDDYVIRIPYDREDVENTIKEFDDTAKKILRKEYGIKGNCDKQACAECSLRHYCRNCGK